MSTTTVLSFSVADRTLALPLADIRRAVPLPLLSPPVEAPHFIEGFFNLRGILVTALKLDRLLGLGDERLGLYTPLLVLADDEPAIALHVRETHGIIRVADEEIRPVSGEDTLNGCVAGCLTGGGGTVYVLSRAGLLLRLERARIEALETLQRRRLEALESEAPS